MNQEHETHVDHHVVRVFELLEQRGWVTRTMQPGQRSILSSPPGSSAWNGVHVRLSGEKLGIFCSGRTAKTYELTFDLLERSPSRIADLLAGIAEHHQLDELAVPS
ncbi:MAG TPA: hypothetical protein VJU61_16830 [Polyangiaceae bacterium]|nr:hypothetical protein [Polyangiaceae bacterium]